MRSAITRTGDIGFGRRLAASAMVAMALMIGTLYAGFFVDLFIRDRVLWLAAAAPLGFALSLAWTRLVSRQRDHELADLGHGLIAWVLALILITYAVAKIYGGQFGPPMEVELDTPLRDLTGFQLTWRFFGHSYTYVMFVAGGQLVAAVLLCFGRTRLLGACLLAPIMTNIVVINFTHQIPVRLLSSILLVLDLYLIAALGGRRLLSFFFGDSVSPHPRGAIRWRRWALKAAALAAFVALICAQYAALRDSWWRPSPVHGTWDVVEVREPGATAVKDWQRIYFENYMHRGTHLGSARTPDGLLRFGYTTDSNDATIRMRLPVRELRGHFELRDDVMTIRGTLGDRPIVLELRSFE